MTLARTKRMSRILCVLLIVLTMFTIVSVPSLAAVPKITASVTKKNVLSLAKKYDPDGFYLLKAGDSVGFQGFMDYFCSNLILSDINTAVHEMCHANTHNVSGYGYRENIYLGNKKNMVLDFTNKMGLMFNTQKMASSIPKQYRTFRYETYVASPDPNLTADNFGPYGLLDEFTAYCYGMNNTISLFPYYKSAAGANFNYWELFINNGANDRLAYAEFRYYILHYLAFAKAKQPKVYKAIMKDGAFRTAFRKIDKKFRSLIKAYNQDLKAIWNLLNSRGHAVFISGDFFYCDGQGTSLFKADYNKLMNHLKKGSFKRTTYLSIYKKLLQ